MLGVQWHQPLPAVLVLVDLEGHLVAARELRDDPITKDTDGFKVDGHTASTLSGSTLDILGLAIRVALTRTFLPTAPFLVLDEPAAAIDGERTELMLGFLVTCGFPQTLLVTHEDISESVADNVITI